MQIRKSLVLAAIMLVSMLALFGCPKKAEVTATPEEQKEEAVDEAARKAEEERLAAEAKAREEAEARERAAAEMAAALKPVYFDFDRSHIREDARETMNNIAEFLKARPDVNIRIEGNADERGTIEYNQALGQRRAASAKNYLTDLGISPDRISIISYGKEKPVCTESTEECWQQNRKDDFVAE